MVHLFLVKRILPSNELLILLLLEPLLSFSDHFKLLLGLLLFLNVLLNELEPFKPIHSIRHGLWSSDGILIVVSQSSTISVCSLPIHGSLTAFTSRSVLDSQG